MSMKQRMVGVILTMVCAAVYAAPVLDATFDSLAVGPIDTGNVVAPSLLQLDAVTSGGSWSLDQSLGRLQSIAADGGGSGDRALLASDSSGDDGSTELGRVVLSGSVLLADLLANRQTLDIRLETAARDGGAGVAYHYTLRNSNQDVVFRLEWSDNGTGSSTVTVNGTVVTATGPDLLALAAWNASSAAIRTLQLSITGAGAFSGTFGAVSFSGTLQNIGVFPNVNALRFEHDGSVAGNKGVYLNDLSMVATTQQNGAVFRLR